MSTISPVEPLSPAEFREASVMLAAAFHDDPFSRFVLPDERSRVRWLRLIHQASLGQICPEGHVYAAGSDGVAGVIGLLPPGRHRLPFWRNVRFMASLLWRLPSGGLPLGRGVRALQAQRLIERLHLREPHWYVAVLGVDPQHQGEGFGRALMDPALARADRERLPTYLETSNERNLGFYGRFGFEVVHEVQTPGGGPPIWTMLRPPVG